MYERPYAFRTFCSNRAPAASAFDAGAAVCTAGWISDDTDALNAWVNTALPMVTRSARWDPMHLLLRTIASSSISLGHVPAAFLRFGLLGELDLAQLGEDNLSEFKIQTAFMKQHRS